MRENNSIVAKILFFLSVTWMKLTCLHKRLCFHSNIYGDQIIENGYNRTVTHCFDCGKMFFSPLYVTLHEFQGMCKHLLHDHSYVDDQGETHTVTKCVLCHKHLN